MIAGIEVHSAAYLSIQFVLFIIKRINKTVEVICHPFPPHDVGLVEIDSPD